MSQMKNLAFLPSVQTTAANTRQTYADPQSHTKCGWSPFNNRLRPLASTDGKGPNMLCTNDIFPSQAYTKRYRAHVIQFLKCLNFAHICCNEYLSKCCIPDMRISQIPEESGTSLGKRWAWRRE